MITCVTELVHTFMTSDGKKFQTEQEALFHECKRNGFYLSEEELKTLNDKYQITEFEANYGPRILVGRFPSDEDMVTWCAAKFQTSEYTLPKNRSGTIFEKHCDINTPVVFLGTDLSEDATGDEMVWKGEWLGEALEDLQSFYDTYNFYQEYMKGK